MSQNAIKRGEIYYITFAPVVGSEQRGGRPGICLLYTSAQGRSEKAGVFMGGAQMRGKRTEPGMMMRTLTAAMVCAGGAVILLLDILAAHI